MTDHDLIKRVISIVDPATDELRLLRKNGKILLGLPRDRDAALRTLRLYQPQTPMARAMVALVRQSLKYGISRFALPKLSIQANPTFVESAFPDASDGTCGILLGSPEHRVRRAIASYKTSIGWEVAKVAFGPDGWDVVQGEANTLLELPENTVGAPKVLALHRGKDISIMRMPLIDGSMLRKGESNKAIPILDAWISKQTSQPIEYFVEWPLIVAAVKDHSKAEEIINHLRQKQLKPVVRHGDFARWNLLQTKDGSIMVLDWEWSTPCGMPGIDLVHLFAQDARLVEKLSANAVIQSTIHALQAQDCQAYLEKTGWGRDYKSAMLASIAFTVGAKQQANEEVLLSLINDW